MGKNENSDNRYIWPNCFTHTHTHTPFYTTDRQTHTHTSFYTSAHHHWVLICFPLCHCDLKRGEEWRSSKCVSDRNRRLEQAPWPDSHSMPTWNLFLKISGSGSPAFLVAVEQSGEGSGKGGLCYLQEVPVPVVFLQQSSITRVVTCKGWLCLIEPPPAVHSVCNYPLLFKHGQVHHGTAECSLAKDGKQRVIKQQWLPVLLSPS